MAHGGKHPHSGICVCSLGGARGGVVYIQRAFVWINCSPGSPNTLRTKKYTIFAGVAGTCLRKVARMDSLAHRRVYESFWVLFCAFYWSMIVF